MRGTRGKPSKFGSCRRGVARCSEADGVRFIARFFHNTLRGTLGIRSQIPSSVYRTELWERPNNQWLEEFPPAWERELGNGSNYLFINPFFVTRVSGTGRISGNGNGQERVIDMLQGHFLR